MSNWKTITPEELQKNPFTLIGKDWGLVTAGTKEKVNTMTVSWGGVGIMWGKPVAFVFIRPQRYTKTFVDNNETFSLSFYDEYMRSTLSYMGSHSGKDVDKIKEMELTTVFEENTPYFEEANIVLCLKKLYKQEMQEANFIDKNCVEKWYPDSDYHHMYVCEIQKVLIK
ncbi:MAG: flavin reductase family protein [Lachnospiraceae bacterium]|nr:flavin reductase family protein [Lachnospiraceae bacterium]